MKLPCSQTVDDTYPQSFTPCTKHNPQKCARTFSQQLVITPQFHLCSKHWARILPSCVPATLSGHSQTTRTAPPHPLYALNSKTSSLSATVATCYCACAVERGGHAWLRVVRMASVSGSWHGAPSSVGIKATLHKLCWWRINISIPGHTGSQRHKLMSSTSGKWQNYSRWFVPRMITWPWTDGSIRSRLPGVNTHVCGRQAWGIMMANW